MRGGKGVRILAAALLLVEAVVAVSPFAAGLRTPWSSPAVSEKSAWRSWRIGGSDDKDEVVRLRGLLTVAESEVASLSDELLDARAAQVRANTSLKAKDEKIAITELMLSQMKAQNESCLSSSRSQPSRSRARSSLPVRVPVQTNDKQLFELEGKLAALEKRERRSEERLQECAQKLAEDMLAQAHDDMQAELEASRMIELATERQASAERIAREQALREEQVMSERAERLRAQMAVASLSKELSSARELLEIAQVDMLEARDDARQREAALQQIEMSLAKREKELEAVRSDNAALEAAAAEQEFALQEALAALQRAADDLAAREDETGGSVRAAEAVERVWVQAQARVDDVILEKSFPAHELRELCSNASVEMKIAAVKATSAEEVEAAAAVALAHERLAQAERELGGFRRGKAHDVEEALKCDKMAMRQTLEDERTKLLGREQAAHYTAITDVLACLEADSHAAQARAPQIVLELAVACAAARKAETQCEYLRVRGKSLETAGQAARAEAAKQQQLRVAAECAAEALEVRLVAVQGDLLAQSAESRRLVSDLGRVQLIEAAARVEVQRHHAEALKLDCVRRRLEQGLRVAHTRVEQLGHCAGWRDGVMTRAGSERLLCFLRRPVANGAGSLSWSDRELSSSEQVSETGWSDGSGLGKNGMLLDNVRSVGAEGGAGEAVSSGSDGAVNAREQHAVMHDIMQLHAQLAALALDHATLRAKLSLWRTNAPPPWLYHEPQPAGWAAEGRGQFHPTTLPVPHGQQWQWLLALWNRVACPFAACSGVTGFHDG